MRSLFVLLFLLPLAACDSAREGSTYDLAFLDADGEVAARIRFERPVGDSCDGLGCGSGSSDWRARDVDDDFLRDYLFGQRSGTLYAQETAFGAYRLTLMPGIADAGVSADIAGAGGRRVEGQWSYDTLSGEVAAGRVEGQIE